MSGVFSLSNTVVCIGGHETLLETMLLSVCEEVSLSTLNITSDTFNNDYLPSIVLENNQIQTFLTVDKTPIALEKTTVIFVISYPTMLYEDYYQTEERSFLNGFFEITPALAIGNYSVVSDISTKDTQSFICSICQKTQVISAPKFKINISDNSDVKAKWPRLTLLGKYSQSETVEFEIDESDQLILGIYFMGEVMFFDVENQFSPFKADELISDIHQIASSSSVHYCEVLLNYSHKKTTLIHTQTSIHYIHHVLNFHPALVKTLLFQGLTQPKS